jgi:hypothetical protein
MNSINANSEIMRKNLEVMNKASEVMNKTSEVMNKTSKVLNRLGRNNKLIPVQDYTGACSRCKVLAFLLLLISYFCTRQAP